MDERLPARLSRRRMDLQPIELHVADFRLRLHQAAERGVHRDRAHLDQWWNIGAALVTQHESGDRYMNARPQRNRKIRDLDITLEMRAQHLLCPVSQNRVDFRSEDVKRDEG